MLMKITEKNRESVRECGVKWKDKKTCDYVMRTSNVNFYNSGKNKSEVTIER